MEEIQGIEEQGIVFGYDILIKKSAYVKGTIGNFYERQ
jgi:hypothetical protein